MTRDVRASGYLPAGWKWGPCADPPKADVRMSKAWTWKDQPPRLKRFEEHRLHGEWFAAGDDLVEFIRRERGLS